MALALDRDQAHGSRLAQERDRVAQGPTGFAAAVPRDHDVPADFVGTTGDRNAEHRTGAFDHQLLDVEVLWIGARIIREAEAGHNQVDAARMVGNVLGSVRIAAENPGSVQPAQSQLALEVGGRVFDDDGFRRVEEFLRGRLRDRRLR